jgi:hypothetical protein
VDAEPSDAAGGESLARFGARPGEGSARLDPLGLARDLSPGAYFEAPAEARPGQGPVIRGRLRPYALTKEDAAQSRRRARRAKYVFTRLPRAIATTRQVFSVHRPRWQVELAIKTPKPARGFHETPHRDTVVGRACVLAKPIRAPIAHAWRPGAGLFPPKPTMRPGPTKRSPSTFPIASLIHPALEDAFLRFFTLATRLQALGHPTSISELTTGCGRPQPQEIAGGKEQGLAPTPGLTGTLSPKPRSHARNA